jgi:hypothetical protein
VAGGAAGDGADRGARARSFGDGARVSGLIALALDFALGLIQLTVGLPIHAADARAKIAGHTVGQGQGIEAHVEFAAAFDAAGLFNLGDRAGHVAAHGNDDAAAHQDGEGGFQVHAVAGGGVLGADGIDQAERHLGAGIHGELGGLCGDGVLSGKRRRQACGSRQKCGCERAPVDHLYSLNNSSPIT